MVLGIIYMKNRIFPITSQQHRIISLQANQTIAVEPIATLGSGRIKLADDQWTLLSA